VLAHELVEPLLGKIARQALADLAAGLVDVLGSDGRPARFSVPSA
jgi:hypothetical protein